METHVPAPITPFIGRANELRAIVRLLTDESCRLLTLVGPGGVGKTRLAIQAAAELRGQFRDGVVFAPLQAVASPEFIVYAIAEALNVGLYERETPRSQLLQYLGRRQVLLVLDNFEHLLDAADFLSQLLEHAPETRLLVTSRAVLNIRGEHLFEVGGLSLPASPQSVEDSDAIRLFAAHAGRVRRDFLLADHAEPVTRICRLVGAMPLAIELAAAWVRALSPADIAAEIERSVDFLATGLRDVPERHRSMRAVFEHSWQRLTPGEQTAFRRLSVFSGAFTREAAESIADTSLDVLSALVDQSLLRVDPGGGYAVHELLRQYAGEKLHDDPEDHARVLERHSAYYLHLLRTLDPMLKSGDQIAGLDTIEAALDNVRAAWAYAAGHGRGDLLLSAIEPLALYYQMRCRLAEGLAAFASAAGHFGDRDEITQAWLLLGQCWFSGFDAGQDMERVTVLTQRVIDIIQRRAPFGFGGMLYMALWHTRQDGVLDLMERNRAAYQASGDAWGTAWSLNQLGSYRRYIGQIAEAQPLLEQSVALFERIGDRWSATWPQALLGFIAEDQGRPADAYHLYSARLQSCQQVGDAGGVAWSLQQIAKVSLLLNDPARARYYCRESLRVALELSSGSSLDEAILRIISVYMQTGRYERAAVLCAVMEAHTDSSSYTGRRIEAQLERLKAELPPDVFQRALDAGRAGSTRDLGWVLLDELADPAPDAVAQQGDIDRLSERELEVLRLTAEGLSNRAIADRLFVTVGTIKKHLNNIYGKLGVERRTEAIARARQMALIP